MRSLKSFGLVGICAAVLGLSGAAPAQAATDPLFVFVPPATVPPSAGFNGPCGVAVDSAASLYVSDYYHHVVDVFDAGRQYKTQLSIDPLDGPCGLAIDSSNRLYVNDYHRSVVRYGASPTFGAGTVIAGAGVDAAHPTGIAIDTFGDTVYVDNRTYISAYDSSGNPVMDGAEPLKIGLGTLADGYGLAFSDGKLYVPDAATNTVRVYQPATDTVNPIATIQPPGIGFVSLRDSAIAIDRASGDIYVADNLQPGFTEQPQAAIQVFSAGGGYKGHLKYYVVDALPPGLAVDNSAGISQGRVYVTSGNSSGASIYAYGPGSATTAPGVCVQGAVCLTDEALPPDREKVSSTAGDEVPAQPPSAPRDSDESASAPDPGPLRHRHRVRGRHRHRARHSSPAPKPRRSRARDR
jgi:hypothetical protein